MHAAYNARAERPTQGLQLCAVCCFCGAMKAVMQTVG